MRHFVLAIALTTFSFNSFASEKCSISFASAGAGNIDHNMLLNKNYEQTDINDLKEGGLLASASNIQLDPLLSGDYFKYISVTQTIQRLYKINSELRVKVISNKTFTTKLRTEAFNALSPSEMNEIIGKLRSANLPKCKVNEINYAQLSL